MLALDQVTHEIFQPSIGQPFTCGAHCELTLTEVALVGISRPETSRLPFALRFQGAPTLRLPQQIYRLENAQLGAMEIFLVQTGADAAASHFEAVFS